jgi:hypothetical protein
MMQILDLRLYLVEWGDINYKQDLELNLSLLLSHYEFTLFLALGNVVKTTF